MWDGEKSIFKSGNSNPNLHRIRNLGFENIKGYYTASGTIWSNKEVTIFFNFCDGSFTWVDVSPDKKFFKATSKVFYYTDTTGSEENPADKASGYNGFLDLEGWTDPEIEVYIEDLKVERGRTPTTWTPSLETNQISWIKPNLINGTTRSWSSWKTVLNQNNYCVYLFGVYANDDYDAYLHAEPGETLTAQVELWFNDIQFTDPNSYISTSGAVNGSWEWNEQLENNPFTNMVRLLSNPGDTVMRFQKSIVVKGNTVRHLKTQVRFDYAPGQFKYRIVSVKKGIVRNLIWCKSEIDTANSNLAIDIRTQTVKQGGMIELEEIDVDIHENPYLTKGIRLTTDEITYGGYIIAPQENTITGDKAYTVSCYVRGKGQFNYQAVILKIDENDKLEDHGNGDYRMYPVLGEKRMKIDSEDWTRISFTITLNTLQEQIDKGYGKDKYVIKESVELELIRVFATINSDHIELGGPKLEEGYKTTPWVPISSQTLDLNPGDYEIIN